MVDGPTALLRAWGRGDQAALDQLVVLVHEELRRIARRHMDHERGGHTLQPTALVNEAYLRLIDIKRIEWQDPREPPLPNSDVVFPDLGKPAAFLCTGTACSSPMFTPAELAKKL